MRRVLTNRSGPRLPILVAVSLLVVGAAFVTGSVPEAEARAQAVTIRVDSVSPTVPVRTATNRPLAVTLTITNSTDEPINDVRVLGERGYPVTTRVQLQDAADKPVTPSGAGLAIEPVRPVSLSLPANSSTPVTFSTTTGIPRDAGICECANAVYPLSFSVSRTVDNGSTTLLASTQTFVPVAVDVLPKLKVDWIWPMLDRPHRTTSDTVFDDDDLTAEVTTGGRLDRALSVVEQVNPLIPLTLLLDPEILDELQVMSTGSYRVRAAAASATTPDVTTVGSGQLAATLWLARLRAALATHPSDEVVLTPYADPDVQTLAKRGRPWSATLPVSMAARISAALGPDTVTRQDVAWPAARRIGSYTVAALARSGVRTIVLDSADARTGAATATGPPGVTALAGPDGTVGALLTDASLQKQIAAAVTVGSQSAPLLPFLLSDLALRVITTPTQARVTVLTPPRYVDPSVADSVATIDATSISTFTAPASLTAVTAADLLPTRTVGLRAVSASADALRNSVSAAIRTVRTATDTIRSLLTVPSATAKEAGAARLTLAGLPLAVQRLQSSAWRTDSGVDATISDRYGAAVTAYVDRIRSAVFIVKPSTGVYTLASTNSDLPISIENDLDFPVSVLIGASTVNGAPGFTARTLPAQVIAARSKRTVHLPTTVQRSGRFPVRAQLSAPDDTPLGSSLDLTVHSTALGRIGVIITISAGALLALALLLRGGRAVVRRRRQGSPARPVSTSGDSA